MFNYHAHFRSAGIKFKASEIFSSDTWMKLNIVLYLPIFTEDFAFAPGPSVLLCSFASWFYLFQISDKNPCKTDSCIYVLTRISFSETLYKKQTTEQRKDTAKTKLTSRWESDGGMGNCGKPSIKGVQKTESIKFRDIEVQYLK